jgi:hypothetical protein
MRKKKQKKPQFVVDAQLLYKDFQEKYKKKASFLSIRNFIGNTDAEDIEIFEKCVSEKRHIITQNYKHFRKIKKSKPNTKVGVVGICTDKIPEAIDQFGNALKLFPSHSHYEGKLITITSSSVLEDKKQ